MRRRMSARATMSSELAPPDSAGTISLPVWLRPEVDGGWGLATGGGGDGGGGAVARRPPTTSHATAITITPMSRATRRMRCCDSIPANMTGVRAAPLALPSDAVYDCGLLMVGR